MTNSTKLTDIPGASEALPKPIESKGDYFQAGWFYEMDDIGDIHLEVDVEAMARINLNVIKSESLKNRNPYVLPEHEYSEFCSCWGCKLSAVIAESNANNLSKWARMVRK